MIIMKKHQKLLGAAATSAVFTQQAATTLFDSIDKGETWRISMAAGGFIIFLGFTLLMLYNAWKVKKELDQDSNSSE